MSKVFCGGGQRREAAVLNLEEIEGLTTEDTEDTEES
jgi:hypothetical protein